MKNMLRKHVNMRRRLSIRKDQYVEGLDGKKLLLQFRIGLELSITYKAVSVLFM